MGKLNINCITDIDLPTLNSLTDIDVVVLKDIDGTVIEYSYSDFCNIKKIITFIKDSIHANTQLEIYSLVTILLSKLIVFDTKVNPKNIQEIKDSASLKCLITKHGICAGIVDAMAKIMQEFDIECYHQRGVSNTSAHSWIKVKLDSKWYEDDTANNIADIRNGKFPCGFLKGIDNKGNREFDNGWLGQFKPYNYYEVPLSSSLSFEDTVNLLGKFGIKRRFDSLIGNQKKYSDIYEVIDYISNLENFNNSKK